MTAGYVPHAEQASCQESKQGEFSEEMLYLQTAVTVRR